MDIDFVFKIAAIGILVSVLSQVLTRAGREDIAMLTTLSGLVIVLVMILVAACAFLFLQRYINSFGSAAAAGVGAAKKIDKYVSEISISIGMATAIFVSQNMGAKKYERVFQGIRRVMVLSFVGIVVTGLPTYLLAPAFVRIFTPDTDAIRYGAMMVTTLVPWYYLQSLHQIFVNTVRGFGKASVAMVTTALGMVAVRQIYLAIAMYFNYDIYNVYVSFPVGWGASALLAASYYFIALRPKFYPLAAAGKTE